MKLSDIPNDHRFARMMALKYTGEKLKLLPISKRLRRKILLDLDLEILLRIEYKLYGPFIPGVIRGKDQ